MIKKASIAVIAVTAALLSGCDKKAAETVVTYQYVDLGLSVKWAKVNVEDESTGPDRKSGIVPESYGRYVAWGETSSKDKYDEENYKWYDENGRIIKYCSNEGYEEPDFLYELEKEDDLATAAWGEEWRTPSSEEFQELLTNCTWTWSSLNGVRGYKVSSKIPGYEDKYIFLPAAGMRMGDKGYPDYEGYYWTSTNCGGSWSKQSNCLAFSISGVSITERIRTIGAQIRPVHE